jgi:hypothetical protein
LAVDELYPFELQEAAGDDVTISSSNREVVDVAERTGIVGRRSGSATVTLAHGQFAHDVLVRVLAKPIRSLRIVPEYDARFLAYNAVDLQHPTVPWDVLEVTFDEIGPVLAKVPEGSVYWDDGWRAGMRPRTVNGDAIPVDPDWFRKHPPRPGDVIDWDARGQLPPAADPNRGDGEPRAPLPEDEAGVPVRLVSWRPLQSAAGSFVPELRLEVSERAEYRIAGPDGAALSDWQKAGPGTTVLMTCQRAVARTADGEYELYVERRTADKPVKRYAVPLTLKPSRP